MGNTLMLYDQILSAALHMPAIIVIIKLVQKTTIIAILLMHYSGKLNITTGISNIAIADTTTKLRIAVISRNINITATAATTATIAIAGTTITITLIKIVALALIALIT